MALKNKRSGKLPVDRNAETPAPFFNVPVHATCRRCHHFHTNVYFSISSETNNHTRFRCERCDFAIFGFGRHSMQTSLASVESLPLSPPLLPLDLDTLEEVLVQSRVDLPNPSLLHEDSRANTDKPSFWKGSHPLKSLRKKSKKLKNVFKKRSRTVPELESNFGFGQGHEKPRRDLEPPVPAKSDAVSVDSSKFNRILGLRRMLTSRRANTKAWLSTVNRLSLDDNSHRSRLARPLPGSEISIVSYRASIGSHMSVVSVVYHSSSNQEATANVKVVDTTKGYISKRRKSISPALGARYSAGFSHPNCGDGISFSSSSGHSLIMADTANIRDQALTVSTDHGIFGQVQNDANVSFEDLTPRPRYVHAQDHPTTAVQTTGTKDTTVLPETIVDDPRVTYLENKLVRLKWKCVSHPTS